MDKKNLTINEFARLGGQARFNKIGKEGMKEMSRKGVEARRKRDLNNKNLPNSLKIPS